MCLSAQDAATQAAEAHREASTGVQKGTLPWHGNWLPDRQLLLITALLILEDALVAPWGSQQGHTALLVCVVCGHAVLNDNSTLWGVVALHQAVTCIRGRLVRSFLAKGRVTATTYCI